ncbi:unnamed protein product [Brassicogethes aeneus]|uniref:Pre-C2HC domain-containing protein n=1 Tax=Brassicogethes aeneus TaxID=1431903 RepID=A0A9P0B6Z6_BRAAE|nr:unnamed protein product [Brassicogethes aeneus]
MEISGDEDEDTDNPLSEFLSKKRKYSSSEFITYARQLSDEQIRDIIGLEKKKRKKSVDKGPSNNTNISQESIQSNNVTNLPSCSKVPNNSTSLPTTSNDANNSLNYKKNTSNIMKKILQKEYLNLFYFSTDNFTTRTQVADLWEQERPHNSDTIIKTTKGFLLKSDSPKIILTNLLKKLQTNKHISNFTETKPYKTSPRTPNTPSISYSCVISNVEKDISDNDILAHLKQQDSAIQYCKRIISRTTNQPTHFIRLITKNSILNEKLLNEGLFFKCRHYAIYPSSPPTPAPLPCSKCSLFTHTTDKCSTPIKCLKCSENHPTLKCTSELPPKCLSCNSTEHQAWSFQCPNRPTKPIEGIPNLPVKSLNKKSSMVDNAKKEARVHSHITIHDHIVNTFLRKLNKSSATPREDIIHKLKQRFVKEFNIETTISFVGNNWIYILMFDLDIDDHSSPTEVIPGKNNGQARAQL